MDTCPLRMPRGTDAELDVLITLPGGIFGQAMTFALYLAQDSNSPIFTKTTGAGQIDLASTTSGGTATVTLLSADTLALAPGTYYWALGCSDTGAIDPYSSGPFVLQWPRGI